MLLKALVKCYQKVRQEVPDGNHTDGKKFRQVKIDLKLTYNQPENKVIQPETNDRDNKEFRVFQCNIRIIAFKGPNPVQNIIGTGRDGKANGVGNILLNFEYLLEKVGKGIID